MLLPSERGHHTANVGSVGMWNLAAALSDRSASSETSITKGLFRKHCVGLLCDEADCGLDQLEQEVVLCPFF